MPVKRRIGRQTLTDGFESFDGYRIGRQYGMGAGGKYCENRGASTACCCFLLVVVDAGTVPTGMYGGVSPGRTRIVAVETVGAPYSGEESTRTFAGPWIEAMRSDSERAEM